MESSAPQRSVVPPIFRSAPKGSAPQKIGTPTARFAALPTVASLTRRSLHDWRAASFTQAQEATVPTTQITLRTKLFRPHEAGYWDARRQAFGEVEWFLSVAAEAEDVAADVGYAGASAVDLEAAHCAAEAAEWLAENPNAVAIVAAQGWLDVIEDWAGMRPAIERLAIELHRSSDRGEGA